METRRILVVEDEMIVAEDIRRNLVKLGYTVSSVVSRGEDAVMNPGEFRADLVLMDIMLKGELDGIDAAMMIRDRFNVPVIFLTAYVDKETLERAKRAGPYGYIIKPFKARELQIALEMAFYKHGMEKRLRDSEERLRMITSSAQDAIIMTGIEGTIQYVNPAFERITGYTAKEAIGANPRILKSGKQDKAFYREMWETLLRGEAWRGHFMNKKKDGSFFEEDATISPIYDSSGKVINFVAVKRDVTREIELEKQLRQAQKMEAIGTLAGGIAHDFNNILTGINGYTELAMNMMCGEGMAMECLNQALKAGLRAKDMVSHILAFSRQCPHELKPLQLHLIVKETLGFLRASLPAAIGVTMEIRENITKENDIVMANPTHMHQVIMNLCVNAAQAMRENGGLLEVDLQPFDADGEFVKYHAKSRPGPYLRLSVRDTGSGMDKETMERIFDPFFTTKKAGEGTGLGLAAVYGIVEDHGGLITVQSEPGTGSVFHVFLPRIGREAKTEVTGSKPVPGGKECILLVDDEEMLAKMGEEMLRWLGYKVVAMTSSLQALEAFRAAPEEFDLVITDQNMPNMNGETLARNILRIRPGIPIVLCTGFSQAINPESAKAMGIRRVLMKPFLTRDMGEAVRRALDLKPEKSIEKNIVSQID